MWYLIAADLVLVVHLLFIGFVVGGSFLTWRWPRLIWVQLPAMAYGALVELAAFACPLTALQKYLLRQGGLSGYRGGFISHYLIRVIYPPGLTRGVQIGLGLCVMLIALVGYAGYLHRRRRCFPSLDAHWYIPAAPARLIAGGGIRREKSAREGPRSHWWLVRAASPAATVRRWRC